jgi:hypothetical protein
MSSTQNLTRQPRKAKSETSGKIYCANCIHCKVITERSPDNHYYYLRVRCDAGKWRKKLGEEKIYKYFTVARRSIDSCDMYEPMGDEKNFLKDLKKNLPITDEEYMI